MSTKQALQPEVPFDGTSTANLVKNSCMPLGAAYIFTRSAASWALARLCLFPLVNLFCSFSLLGVFAMLSMLSATRAFSTTMPVYSQAAAASSILGNPPSVSPPDLSRSVAQGMVHRVLQTELASASDSSQPMQYLIRKTSPRISTTKRIVETKDGDVALLIAINGNPLSQVDRQTEDARLDALMSDPTQQRHRQQREEGDAERLRNIIRALPDAFVYDYAGIVETPHGPSYRMSFQPNPNFNPQDIESQALKAMAGELWIDAAQQRVTRLEGKRLHDVEYGWGLIGKLEKGGTLLLEQADIGDHQWRTTHLVLVMNARVLFKSVKLDTALELSQFSSVSTGIDYRKGIELLRDWESPSAPKKLSEKMPSHSEAAGIVSRPAPAVVE